MGFDVMADGSNDIIEGLGFPKAKPIPVRRWKGEVEVGRLPFFSCQRQMTRALERRASWLPSALGIISSSPSETVGCPDC